jgi:hypothetical protein
MPGQIGNSGGKPGRSGRKSKAAEFGLAALLDRVWTIKDREEVIKVLHANAVAGNERAAALLLAYAYGKPTERIQHNIQIAEANKEYVKLREEFPDLEADQLREWFAALKGIQPEQITELPTIQ